ncbi:Hypothetical predicted protein [Pelobates cultripes]|uniref:Uncharacterized protein n=1 Tax=Pelobates cultripes TaxID=61616 RepID=A0AAD1T8H2_PELCU|nr:Hypothetical predicted protein [Pelobates cultripes]
MRNMEVALRTDLWKEDIDETRPFQCKEILTTNQHQAEQLELWMQLLVSELETLVETEPWLIEYKCIEGEDYNGPDLLWDTIETSLWFGDTNIACFWSIRAERADKWDLTEIDDIQPDLSFLDNREWELEQDYVCLFQRTTPPVSDIMGLINCIPPEALSLVPPPQQPSLLSGDLAEDLASGKRAAGLYPIYRFVMGPDDPPTNPAGPLAMVKSAAGLYPPGTDDGNCTLHLQQKLGPSRG